MRSRALLVLSFASAACGGPDARSMKVEFDLLSAACEDAARCGEHVFGTAVVAKTGSPTDDGFITDSGLPLIHAEGDTRSSSVAIIEIVIPGSQAVAPHVRYHEIVHGRLAYEGVATNVTEAALDANDWSQGGTFAFDAESAKSTGDVRRIRNGYLGAVLPEPRAGGEKRLHRAPIDLGRVTGDRGRRDGESDVFVTIDDLARFGDAIDEASSPSVSVPVDEPGPGPSDSPSASPSASPSGDGSSDSGGGGCSGDSSSSSSSSSDASGSSCGGSSSDSSGSSCDSCGGTSSDGASSCGGSGDAGSSCGGSGDAGSSCGGGGCSGDAAPSTDDRVKVKRAAGATVRFMWPVGIVGIFNRSLRAISRRRRRSPSANHGSPAIDDRR